MSYFHPTLDELRQVRHDALIAALAMYRREHACHPRDTRRAQWTEARRYWTAQAYHAHGEILARLDPLAHMESRPW